MAKIETLVQDFDAGPELAYPWLLERAWSGVVGRAEMRSDNSATARVQLDTFFDLVESSIYLQVEVEDADNGDFNFFLLDVLSASVRFQITENELRVWSPTVVETVTYNAANHKWLRIREDTGTLYFEAAPDNAGVPGAWVEIYSTLTAVASFFDPTQVKLIVEHNGGGSSLKAWLDGINTGAGDTDPAPQSLSELANTFDGVSAPVPYEIYEGDTGTVVFAGGKATFTVPVTDDYAELYSPTPKYSWDDTDKALILDFGAVSFPGNGEIDIVLGGRSNPPQAALSLFSGNISIYLYETQADLQLVGLADNSDVVSLTSQDWSEWFPGKIRIRRTGPAQLTMDRKGENDSDWTVLTVADFPDFTAEETDTDAMTGQEVLDSYLAVGFNFDISVYTNDEISSPLSCELLEISYALDSEPDPESGTGPNVYGQFRRLRHLAQYARA